MTTPSLFPPSGVIVDEDGRAEVFPGFLGHEDADTMFAELLRDVRWEQADLVVFGRRTTEPRMSVWCADDGVPYVYSGTKRTAHPIPSVLEPLRERIEEVTRARYNSVLINLYRDGNDRLGWHADNEECNGPEPTIASISLGAERRFDLRHRGTGRTERVLLPHGSLLVMSGTLQRHWLHQVPPMKRVTAPRINLTFRHVS